MALRRDWHLSHESASPLGCLSTACPGEECSPRTGDGEDPGASQPVRAHWTHSSRRCHVTSLAVTGNTKNQRQGSSPAANVGNGESPSAAQGKWVFPPADSCFLSPSLPASGRTFLLLVTSPVGASLLRGEVSVAGLSWLFLTSQTSLIPCNYMEN